MRTSSFIVILFLFSFLLAGASCVAQTAGPTDEYISNVQRRYNLDPATSLMSRMQSTPAGVLTQFRNAGMSPIEHTLTTEEQEKVAAAFESLPTLHKSILKRHLRSISFLDHMPNTALTSTVNADDSFPLFDLTIRAEILHQNVSEWLTEKERTCFDTAGSNARLFVEAGHLDAIQYVLLHEATHIVDGYIHLTPRTDTAASDFTRGVWSGRTIVAAGFKDALLDGIMFRRGGKVLSVDEAARVYDSLSRSPFASLYSRNSWHEDVAEFVTIYHFTRKRRQSFRVVLQRGKEKVVLYEPIKNTLVQNRRKLMKRFYKVAYEPLTSGFAQVRHHVKSIRFKEE